MDALAKLVVWESALQDMRQEVARWAPEEACGLAAGRPGLVEQIYPVANRLHSSTRFEMDPLEQLRAFQEIEAAGLELVAIYHSHPLGPPNPSPTDLAEFAYPGVIYLIWMPESDAALDGWEMRGYDLDRNSTREIPVDIR